MKYTLIDGIYLVIREGGWVTICKNPVSILEASNKSSSEDEISSNKDQPNIPKKEEPEKPKPKRYQKPSEEFPKLYGSQKSTWNKGQINLLNDPSEQETKKEPNWQAWSKGRQVKLEQLNTYGVYLIVDEDSIPEKTRIVNTK